MNDHANRRRKRNQALLNDFVIFGLRLAASKARRHEYRHGFSHEARAGIELENAAPVKGSVSGFFEQFALSSWQFLFAGVDTSGGELPKVIAGGVAK